MPPFGRMRSVLGPVCGQRRAGAAAEAKRQRAAARVPRTVIAEVPPHEMWRQLVLVTARGSSRSAAAQPIRCRS
jgi:hypothetical protein